MNENSNVSNFYTRLQKKAAQEREQIEAIFQSQLNELAANLKSRGSRAVSTIERNTHIWDKRMSWVVLKAWVRPVAVGLALFLGICGGSWGLMRWLSSEIQSRLETRDFLDSEIAARRNTVQQLTDRMWGMYFHEDPTGRYLVLSEGTTLDTQTIALPGGLRGVKLLDE